LAIVVAKAALDSVAELRRTAINGLRDDAGVPLICPTCQVSRQASMLAAYFAWGCFRYF
jgi:hypothetical protein